MQLITDLRYCARELAEHWEIVSVAATLLLMIGNALTKHFSNSTKLVRVLAWIMEMLSPFTSKDVPGWLKAPFTSVTPAQGAMKERIRQAREADTDPRGRLSSVLVPLAVLVGASLLAASWTGCSVVYVARRPTVRATTNPWTDADCRKAATKRAALLAVTSVLGAAAGGTGIAAPFPDGQDKRIVLGVTAAVSALGAAGVAPFLSQVVADLHDHCEQVAP
jgi:hypothetical protein